MDQADIPGEHPLWNTSIQNKYRQSFHLWRSSLKLIAVVEKTWAFSLVNKRLWLTLSNALLRCTATTATESLASRLARRRAGMTLNKTRDIQRYVQLKVSACNKFSSILKRRCVWICLNRFFSRETPWPLWSYSRYRPLPSVSYQTRFGHVCFSGREFIARNFCVTARLASRLRERRRRKGRSQSEGKLATRKLRHSPYHAIVLDLHSIVMYAPLWHAPTYLRWHTIFLNLSITSE